MSIFPRFRIITDAPKAAYEQKRWYVERIGPFGGSGMMKRPLNRIGQLFLVFSQILALGFFIFTFISARNSSKNYTIVGVVGVIVTYAITYVIAEIKTYKKKR